MLYPILMNFVKKWKIHGQNHLILITGYLITEATWEPESSFFDNSNLLETYKQCNQL